MSLNHILTKCGSFKVPFLYFSVATQLVTESGVLG